MNPTRDRERAGGERPDHRDDLDEAGERADEEPVRLADRPEEQRQRRSRRATISSTWPRTNAPSFAGRSASTCRGRACASVVGSSEQTRSIALSRSKIQYAAAANVKKMPITTSNAFDADLVAGLDELESLRQVLQPLLQRDEHLVLDAGRVAAPPARSRALPLGLSAWSTWSSARGHGERERDRDQRRASTR